MQRPTNLKVGDMFRVTKGDSYFHLGEIITLKQDGDVGYPYFWNTDKSNFWNISFSYLEPHIKTIRDAQVGDVVIDEDGEECMVLERLQNSVSLSLANDFKKTGGDLYTFYQLGEYYILKDAPEVVQTILTMAQIAEKFGVDVSKLKIAKD